MISGVVAFAIVVSHTTTRFDAPSPVTYAFIVLTFSLAAIQYIRSTGIVSPARSTTRSNARVSGASCSDSGSNLLNSGSITPGARKTSTAENTTAPAHAHNHHFLGLLRIAATTPHTATLPTIIVTINSFALSPNHEAHP